MTEVDIWIKVLDTLELIFKDEYCFSTYNTLEYEGLIESDFVKIKVNFCRKTETVSSLKVEKLSPYQMDINDEIIIHNKQSFKEKYKDIFRDIKISSLI